MNTERKNDQIVPQETMVDKEKIYHNTRFLLRKYRDVAFAVQSAEIDLAARTMDKYGTPLTTLKVNAELAGIDLTGTKAESHARSLTRSKEMLAVLQTAAECVKKYPRKGEVFHRILYLTYFDPKERNREEILRELTKEGEGMSMKTYSKYLKQAILVLDGLLWGYDTADCRSAVEEVLKSYQP